MLRLLPLIKPVQTRELSSLFCSDLFLNFADRFRRGELALTRSFVAEHAFRNVIVSLGVLISFLCFLGYGLEAVGVDVI